MKNVKKIVLGIIFSVPPLPLVYTAGSAHAADIVHGLIAANPQIQINRDLLLYAYGKNPLDAMHRELQINGSQRNSKCCENYRLLDNDVSAALISTAVNYDANPIDQPPRTYLL